MQDAIILYENGKAIGGEGHPTNASDITFDNSNTDLVSENVENAIKEVNAKTSGLTRMTIGWTNPSPTASFVAQTITLSDNDYDALEVDTAYVSGGSQSVYTTSKLKKNGKTELQLMSASGTNLQYFFRAFTDDGNGHVQITNGRRIMQGSSTQYDADNALVPQEIRLIKYI